MREKRGLLTRLGSLGRWLLLTILACAAGLVVCRQLVLARLDEQIRVRVERMFAGHYRDLDVRIEAARRIEGQGIEIRGVTIRSKSGQSQCRDLVYVDEMFLACPADLADLFTGHPNVRQLNLRRMNVFATCYEEGQWNIAELLPVPDFGGSIPLITIEDSTVELRDVCRQAGGRWALRDIDMQVRIVAAPGASKKYQLAGTLLGDHFKRVKIQGAIDPNKDEWSAWGTMDDLEMSPGLLGALPADVAEYLSFLTTLRARGHFEFRVGHKAEDPDPIQCVLKGHLSEGRVDDPRLPMPLTDLEADIFGNNRQLRIENATARSGATSLALTCRYDDFLTSSPRLHLAADVKQLALDDRVYRVLPVKYRADWDKFSPAGIVDVNVDLSMRDQRMRPDIRVTCRDISFAYSKFPFRLQRGSGLIHWEGDTVHISEFTAFASGQVVRIAGEFKDPGPNSTGWLTLQTDGPVPLDDELISAMTPTGQKIVRSLKPTGGIILTSGRIERRLPGQPAHTRWDIELSDCAVQYDRFPYTIRKIAGKLVLVDKRWEFQGLQGYHGSSFILCNGGWVPSGNGMKGGTLTLNFKGWDVMLDDALRGAVAKLSSGAERFWASVRPRGTVDHVNIAVVYNSRTKQTQIDMVAEKWPPDQNVEGRSISVHPNWLPLRMDNVVGRVRYTDGKFQLENVSAVRGNSRLELAGHGNVTRDHRWDVQLTRLVADRISVDHEFIDALPAEMRQAIRQLRYRGFLSVNGSTWLRGGEGLPLIAGWDVLLDIEDGALDSVLKLEHIHGGIRLFGEKKPQGFHSHGRLEIDSLISRDIQVTQIEGPFWMDARQVVFGSRTPAVRPGPPPGRVTARAMSGNVAMDAHLLLDSDLRFAVDVSMTEGDIVEFARSMHARPHDISGKVYAKLGFQGSKAGLHTLQGGGRVGLREANIYQLPVMVELLSVLTGGQPDNTAFTSSDIEFRLKGEQIYLDRIDFNGDAISLKGKGWMDLSRRINLDFYALVGRREIPLPMVRAFLAEASRNILLIQVVGTVDAPEVIRKPLPELDETLKRIFPETEPRTAGASIPSSASGRQQ